MIMTNRGPMSRLLTRFAGLICPVAGILSAMSFIIGQEGYAGMSDLPASSSSYLWGAMAVCLWLLYRHVYIRLRVRLSPAQVVWGLIFGLVNVLGTTLFAYDSWAMLQSPVQLAFALLRASGQAMAMMAAFGWMSHLLESGVCVRESSFAGGGVAGNGDGNAAADAAGCDVFSGDAAGNDAQPAGRLAGLAAALRKHESLTLWLGFCLCWLPYVLVFFPGTVCWDLGEAAQMFFGLRPMNAWHGVLATWLFGGCVWLGRLVHSDNLGILLYVLLQLGLLAHMAAQMLVFLRRRGLNRAFRLAVFCFFALTPIWGGYVQFVGKDTLYVAALGLFLVRCAEALLARESAGQPRFSLWRGVETFLYGLLACTIRPNGLIAVLPMAALMFLVGWKGEATAQRRVRLRAASAGLCAALAAVLFSYALVPALGITDDTGSALYSPLFQQSARALRDHGDTVTPEEYAAIDHVLDGANLPELYEPWISDPVKYTFRFYGQEESIQQESLVPYRQAWLSMLKKYPLTYAEAFFAGNVSYYSFTPKMEGPTYNNQAGSRLVFENYINQMGDDPRLVHVTQPVPESIRLLTAAFARGWRHIPLLGLLYCCAFYTWVLAGAALSLGRQKRRLALWLFVPALLSLITCCISPVNDYFRYFLPVVAMTPLLVGVSVKPANGH